MNLKAAYFAAKAAYTSLAFLSRSGKFKLLNDFSGEIQVFTFRRKGL